MSVQRFCDRCQKCIGLVETEIPMRLWIKNNAPPKCDVPHREADLCGDCKRTFDAWWAAGAQLAVTFVTALILSACTATEWHCPANTYAPDGASSPAECADAGR